MKPIGSAITISPEDQLTKTGTPHGEPGLVTRENSEAMAQWLVRHSVAEADTAAVSRANSHGVGLRVLTELRFPSGPNGEHLPSYEVAVGCDVQGSDSARQNALADLEKMLAPAPIRSIEDWLAELSVLTAGRSRDGMDAALTFTAYSSRLSKYPADVARHALLEHGWQWWPSWDELRKVCDCKSGPRRQMIAALKQPAPEPKPKRRPPTQEERDRVQAMVDEKFPSHPSEMRKAAVDEVLKGNCFVETPNDPD